VKIRFYGVRGSVPTPGPSTVRYGGNTVCVDVRLADGTVLILDGGTGLRELGKQLAREGHKADITMLLTHLHWDHIIGIPFFAPMYDKDATIHLYPVATAAQQRALERRALFDGVHFPLRAADIPAQIDFVDDGALEWRIGSATVRRIALNHPGGAQGYRIDDDGGAKIAYLTDNELSPPGDPETTMSELARFAEGTDLLIHDAQYFAEDMPKKLGWGHSTVDDVLALAKEAGSKRLALFHHDPDRHDDELDLLQDRAESWLKTHAKDTDVTVAREGWTLSL
jgi:phosphoribosyl 1,2-cyclic phosphodiesterase